MSIPEEVKAVFEKQSLIAFGTADKAGTPNVVPIFWKKIVDENRIWLVDNYMQMSKRNLLENGSVCLSFWDPETKDAYKLIGNATYHTEGPVFEQGRQFIHAKKPESPAKGIVEIVVTDAYILKPGPDAGKKL